MMPTLMVAILASVVITVTPPQYMTFLPMVANARYEMAFPQTVILDDFNRADEGPPMMGWVDMTNGLQVNTNQCRNSSADASLSVYNHVYSNNQEVYVTLPTLPPPGSSYRVRLYFRYDPTNGTGYSIDVYLISPVSAAVSVRTWPGAATIWTTTRAIGAGDAFGVRAVDNAIMVWYKASGGSWTHLGSVEETTYRGAYLGIGEGAENTSRLDDFGGGDYVASVVDPALTATVIEATVYDKSGTRIAQINPGFESVAWRLNNEGLARFRMAYTDSKCTRGNLALGNRLLLRFGNGLPDWGGVIDTPRSRDDLGVTCTAYTGEHIFGWRETGKNDVYNSMTPGAIYRAMLDAENAAVPTGITAESIFLGGNAISREYHLHELQRQYMELAKGIDHDWSVTPVISAGVLSFLANWYERRGTDKSANVWLVGGRNIVGNPILDEQGVIANHIDQAGEGSDWGSTRYMKTVEDAASRAEFGYREWGEVTAGITSQATIDAHANARLAEMAWPVYALSLTVQNSKPAYYAAYDVGDIVRAQCFLKWGEWAYDGLVRIIAREFMPASHQCRLEVQEWRGS